MDPFGAVVLNSLWSYWRTPPECTPTFTRDSSIRSSVKSPYCSDGVTLSEATACRPWPYLAHQTPGSRKTPVLALCNLREPVTPSLMDQTALLIEPSVSRAVSLTARNGSFPSHRAVQRTLFLTVAGVSHFSIQIALYEAELVMEHVSSTRHPPVLLAPCS